MLESFELELQACVAKFGAVHSSCIRGESNSNFMRLNKFAERRPVQGCFVAAGFSGQSTLADLTESETIVAHRLE